MQQSQEPSLAETAPSKLSESELAETLNLSRREAVASSAMTTTCDNFLNAFAIHLRATSLQMGWLTAIPQLAGAIMQLASVWIGSYCPRKTLIIIASRLQTAVMALLVVIALWSPASAPTWLIILAVFYHGMINLIQPHWRAWIGGIVPARERGVFFAGRTRITMGISLTVFLCGGIILTLSEGAGFAWLGFAFLFAAASAGRFISSRLLGRMHDPAPHPILDRPDLFFDTLRQVRTSLHDKTFRSYSLFVAGMQGAVAISAPFFAVYMLNDLQFTYLQYSLNSIASIATQFLTLSIWGRVSDRHGNRLVMLGCSVIIPIVPMLWMVMPNFYYLLLVQVISGIVWGGLNLSMANYLYDIRPHHTNFATYAAVQSAISATFVFTGALLGGLLASAAPAIVDNLSLPITSSLFLVFLVSGLARAGVLVWFIPHAEEPSIRTRPQLLQLVFRVARFNAISGIVLDWLTVTEKRDGREDSPEDGNSS